MSTPRTFGIKIGQAQVIGSLVATLVFVLLSSKTAYKFTSGILKTTEADGCPTTLGLWVHGILAGMLVYFLSTQLGGR